MIAITIFIFTVQNVFFFMPQQRFYDATEKLVNAFLMGTIEHGNCRSCAVGNLCDGSKRWTWYHSHYEDAAPVQEAKKEMLNTGYSILEIYQIEKAFEFREKTLLEDDDSIDICFDEIDADGFWGLCNVFDYLVSIEDWKDEESKVNLIEMCLQNN